MKIRTITFGFNGSYPIDHDDLTIKAELLYKIRSRFKDAGFEVQTIRMALQPWRNYIHSDKELSSVIADFDQFCTDTDIEYINLGTTHTSEDVAKIYTMNKQSTHLFSSALLANKNTIYFETCIATAKLIKKLAPLEREGFANLRFAALFNLPPNCPFFPAAYHNGQQGIGIGTENSSQVYHAFKKAKDLSQAAEILHTMLTEKYSMIESLK